MAVAGVICFFSMRCNGEEGREGLSPTLRDVATQIFGFSLLWAGMFVERAVILAPIARLNPGVIVPEFALMLFLAGVLASGRRPSIRG